MLTVPGNSLVLGDKVPIAVHEQAVQYLAFYAFFLHKDCVSDECWPLCHDPKNVRII